MIDLRLGDCVEVMRGMDANSVDSIVTDPPYELGFMGKAWDGSGVAFQVETWQAALRVAKPGALLLAFGGTRTWHRLACAIEDAGWEIRDTVCWLYGSGFPKSHDISKAIDKAAGAEREVVGVNADFLRRNPVSHHKQDYGEDYGNPSWKDGEQAASITAPATPLAALWSGWGTALKPAFEPVIVAMKPLDGTFAHNAETWGCAGMNIDGSRIPTMDCLNGGTFGGIFGNGKPTIDKPIGFGRWPANVILDEDAAALLDEQSGERPSGAGNKNTRNRDNRYTFGKGLGLGYGDGIGGDTGGASRFFYCAKASRSEREAGLEGMEERRFEVANHGMALERWPDGTLRERVTERQTARNVHPCVKPLALMRYLVRLCKTPTGGIVLDPFMGSGTTGVACVQEGRDFIGIEKDEGYMAIAQKRIDAAQMQGRLL